ncbi:MAG: hypothetical protein ACK4GC_15915, partial [Paracoccaceae bacterium]
QDHSDPEAMPGVPSPEAASPPFSKALYNKKQIPQTHASLDEWPRDNADKLVVGDVMPLAQSATWLSQASRVLSPGCSKASMPFPCGSWRW